MKALKQAQFLISAGRLDQLPQDNLPEIAFAGRSNVGKSSLVNTLLGRKALAKVSGRPGRTQTLNLIDLGGVARFVDLPGYGFAKVSKSLKKQWGQLIGDYLATRENLAAVVVILDIRRDPSGEDLDLIAWLGEEGIPVLFALTKADKLSKQQANNRRFRIAHNMGLQPDDLFLFSSLKKTGKDTLLEAVLRLAGLEET